MRSGDINWQKTEEDMDRDGFVRLPNLLDAGQCRRVINGFEEDRRYRRHIVMQRHGYGQGEYKYFDYPLPELVAELREEFYAPLADGRRNWRQVSDSLKHLANIQHNAMRPGRLSQRH